MPDPPPPPYPNTVPPLLPPLIAGQRIRSGPYIITVTDEMVAQRERENQELRRILEQQISATMTPLGEGSRFAGEFRIPKTRRKFIRIVFFILFIQLCFTAAIISTFMLWDTAHDFILRYWEIWIGAVGTIITILCIITASEYARRRPPYNIICLILFTIALSYIAAAISAKFDVFFVLIAVASTSFVTIAMSTIATFTKFDLTKRSGLMVIVSIIGFVGIFVMLFLAIFTSVPMREAQMAVGLILTFLMSTFLYFDIQTLMGNTIKALDSTEYVYASMKIYMDIILMYKYILLIIGYFVPGD